MPNRLKLDLYDNEKRGYKEVIKNVYIGDKAIKI